MPDISDQLQLAFDQIFDAYTEAVRAKTTDQIAWEFEMAVDKWDMKVQSTAAVEINGQEYKFRSDTMYWELNWTHEIAQVEMWADWTIEHVLRQMRNVFVK